MEGEAGECCGEAGEYCEASTCGTEGRAALAALTSIYLANEEFVSLLILEQDGLYTRLMVTARRRGENARILHVVQHALVKLFRQFHGAAVLPPAATTCAAAATIPVTPIPIIESKSFPCENMHPEVAIPTM